MNICIIDDNKDMTTMLEKFFTIKGHQCLVVNDGREALDILQRQNFDVVLLDLAMPAFSGNDIVDHLSRDDKIKDMKIIVLTASSPSLEYEDNLRSKGIHIILKKPVDPDVLLDNVIRNCGGGI